MTRVLLRSVLAAGALAVAVGPAHAITVTFIDLIPNGSRTNFVGFEALPSGAGISNTYVEDGVRVDQVSGESNDIWSECSTCFGGSLEGDRAWYPEGGDFAALAGDVAFTRITRVGGLDFESVGFRTGSGWIGGITVRAELWNDGVLVFPYEYLAVGYTAGYLGFSGGGFDEIRMRDWFADPLHNAFAVDSIELAGGPGEPIPEPGTLLLLGAGLAGLSRMRRRRSG